MNYVDKLATIEQKQMHNYNLVEKKLFLVLGVGHSLFWECGGGSDRFCFEECLNRILMTLVIICMFVAYIFK